MTGVRAGAGLQAGLYGWVVGLVGLWGLLPSWVWVCGTSSLAVGSQPSFAT